MNKLDTTIPVRYGLIAGFTSVAIAFIFYIFYKVLLGNFWVATFTGIISFLIVLMIGIFAGITYRKAHNNIISFGNAFTVCFMVFVINTAFTSAVQWIIPNVVDKEYAEESSKLLREKIGAQMEKMGAPEESIEKSMRDMGPEKFNPPPKQFALNILKSLALYAVLSLLIAAFIKRNSADVIPVENSN